MAAFAKMIPKPDGLQSAQFQTENLVIRIKDPQYDELCKQHCLQSSFGAYPNFVSARLASVMVARPEADDRMVWLDLRQDGPAR